MNIKLMGAFIVGVVLVAGGYYVFSKQNEPALIAETGVQEQIRTGNTESGTQEGGAWNGTFMSLMQRTGDWQCTVDTATTQAVTSGTVYISDGKVHGEFTSMVEGTGQVTSYMIADGSSMYTWSSMMSQGIKMPKATLERFSGQNAPAQAADLTVSYGYNCEPWNPDASKFVPPSTVSFMEFAL